MSRLAGRLARLAQRLAPCPTVHLVFPDDHPGLSVDQILAAQGRPRQPGDRAIVLHGIRHDAQGRRVRSDGAVA
jgi:hypothetical protein